MKKLFSTIIYLLPVFLLAQHQGLLWRITSAENNQHTSYLFGTMHTTDSRAFQFPPQVLPSIELCDAFAMEILVDDNSIDMQMMLGLMMTDGTTLQSLFSGKDYVHLDSLLTVATGFSISLIDNIQPIILMALLEQAGMNKDSLLPLDLHLLEYAKTKNKKVMGIETIAEQLNALQSLTYQEQAEMISLELNRQQDDIAVSDSLIAYYAAGKLDSLLALNNRFPMPEKLAKALLDNRNQIMAERIAEIVKKQRLFAAIGALHLPGTNGVIELLRRKGLKVEAVQQ